MLQHAAVCAFNLPILKVSERSDVVEPGSAQPEIQGEHRVQEDFGAVASDDFERPVPAAQPMNAFRDARSISELKGK
jgi:hypothetical protein